jgi:uncharacterized protein YdaU (DUF1376 family)
LGTVEAENVRKFLNNVRLKQNISSVQLKKKKLSIAQRKSEEEINENQKDPGFALQFGQPFKLIKQCRKGLPIRRFLVIF